MRICQFSPGVILILDIVLYNVQGQNESKAECMGVNLSGPCSIHVVYIIENYLDIL